MEIEKLKNSFEEVYESKIKPNTVLLEEKRLKALKKYKILFAFSISFLICAFACWVLCALTRNGIFACGFLLFVFVMIPLLILINKIKDDFRKEVKGALLKHLLSIFGMFYIAKDSPLSLRDIKDFGLFHQSSRKTDDDNIVGEYNGTPVIVSETKLSHSQKTGRHSVPISDFEGLILTVKFSKKFEGTSILIREEDFSDVLDDANMVIEDERIRKKISNIKNSLIFKFACLIDKHLTNRRKSPRNNCIKVKVYDLLTHKKKEKILKRVFLEDVEFNKMYNIFSDSQVESRYILNPSFMEKIRDFENNFMTTCMGIVFDGNTMYMFLNNYIAKDTINNLGAKIFDINKSAGMQISSTINNGLFEITDLSETLSSKENFEKVFSELVEIFSLIDYFIGDKNR